MLSRMCAVLIVIIAAAPGCAGDDNDRSMAARVGQEIITRGFVRHAMASLAVPRGDARAERQVLESVVRNTLVACKAREEGVDAAPPVRLAARGVVGRARRDFLCASDGEGSEGCDARLFESIKKKYRLALPAIDGERLVVRVRRPFIPLGGTIPPPGSVEAAPGGLPFDMAYASSLVIGSSVVRCTLADLIIAMEPDEHDRMLDEATRGAVLRSAVVGRHLDALVSALPEGRRALLSEVERRAVDNLLVEAYRRSIGFENITGGPASSRVYPVTPDEALRFYRANPALFQEPVSVDLSHIRIRDAATADELRRDLEKDPGRFCELARRHSIAPDAASCGRIGVVSRVKGLPLYQEFGFTLTKAGQISIPFKTPDGVEILLLNRRTVRQRSFDDPYTRKLVGERMQLLKREERYAAAIEEMKQRHPVVYGR